MKRYITMLCLLVISCLASSAKQLTPTQRKAKVEIFNTLKKIGSNVREQDDERISFTSNDINYIVHIVAENQDPLYLTIAAVFSLPEEYNSDIASKAALKAAVNLPVYANCTENILVFDCEMYAKSAKPFIDVLPNMISALRESVSKFEDSYNEVKATYNPITTSSTTTASTDCIYPIVSSTSNDSRLYIKRVTVNANNTVLEMVSYNGGEYQNCGISKNSFISVDGKKLYLKNAEGISYLPKYTDYPNYKSGREVSLTFKLYFPPIPAGTKSFDFSEGNDGGWKINGVKMENGRKTSINGEQIETSYHIWNCVGIEVRDGQTLLTKTVKPKSDGTYMFSSQDEYIEDAETGRKYYLLNSSIGFEGNPEISHNTNKLEFYEIYPNLPANVRVINISSGSQYYIKNLRIR